MPILELLKSKSRVRDPRVSRKSLVTIWARLKFDSVK